jgi:hypothetical protein
MNTTSKQSKPKLTEEDILIKVQAKVRNCVSWFDSKLSKEREKVINYFDATHPRRQHDGNSSYVSDDVYEAVESMKAQLLETFSSGNDILRFTPHGVNDVIPARVATAYCTHIIFEENDGFTLFDEVIHDGLTARNAVARVYWDEKYAYNEEHFTDLSQDEVMALHGQDEVSELTAELNPHSLMQGMPTYDGSFKIKLDKCRIVIDTIAPEEFYISARAKRREDATRGHRVLKTRADLIAMGFPKDKVDSVSWDDDRSMEMSPEAQARDAVTMMGSTLGTDAVQDELQRVMLHETYMDFAMGSDGTAALYKFIHAGAVLFDYEEVDEDPYLVYAPLRMPHTWFGGNFAARVIPTQNARTVLTRSILDHAAITNNPRYQVVQGALLNPREMLDNRMGGLVNVTRPDGVSPLQQSTLNPFVFETLKTLKDNKEESTGISSLSQGMNKDAISTQNSAALVDNLVTLSQVRQKIIARRFARQFLIPLYLKVYRIAMQYEKKSKVIEVAGEYATVSPQDWQDRTRVSCSLALGYGEQDKESAKYVEMWKLFTQDPEAKKFCPPEKQYKLLTDAMVKNKVQNYADYTITPDKLPQPQPNPIEMGKVQAMLKQADAALTTANAAANKSQVSLHHEEVRTQLDERKFQQTVIEDNREQDRKDIETASKINVAQRELQLAEELPATSQRGILSPNP